MLEYLGAALGVTLQRPQVVCDRRDAVAGGGAGDFAVCGGQRQRAEEVELGDERVAVTARSVGAARCAAACFGVSAEHECADHLGDVEVRGAGGEAHAVERLQRARVEVVGLAARRGRGRSAEAQHEPLHEVDQSLDRLVAELLGEDRTGLREAQHLGERHARLKAGHDARIGGKPGTEEVAVLEAIHARLLQHRERRGEVLAPVGDEVHVDEQQPPTVRALVELRVQPQRHVRDPNAAPTSPNSAARRNAK
ncbi:hypothetical protein [Nannocystis pusilla]|uniref:hypothetical protein n=1 Tax=Nannocystis pusilla TaxID=889268 RepID=UPI003B7EB49D